MAKYVARKGSVFSNAQANIYGNCVAKIEVSKGSISPIDVVEEGKNPSSPLHNYFDWDNEIAADKYRLQQARYLLNHLVVVITIDGEQKEQNAFVNVVIDDEGQGYLSLNNALSVKVYREQVLDNALRELVYWQDRYKDLKELSVIFTAINKVKSKISKKKKRKKP